MCIVWLIIYYALPVIFGSGKNLIHGFCPCSNRKKKKIKPRTKTKPCALYCGHTHARLPHRRQQTSKTRRVSCSLRHKSERKKKWSSVRSWYEIILLSNVCRMAEDPTRLASGPYMAIKQ